MLFADDPMLIGPIDLSVLLIVIGKVVIVFVLLLVATMLMIWFERKLVGDMQNRVGPNLAGPFGVLQTLADGIKFFFKEDLIPERANRAVFMLAPFLSFVPAFLLFAVVPIGGDFNAPDHGTITVFGHVTYMQVADPPIGILFVLAMSSIAVYGVMLAGWSSGSKYPLFGSVRASAQMVSYEAAMGLAVVAVILKAGTLTTHGIVEYQAGPGWGNVIPNWGLLVTGIIPFVIFVIAGTAELNRPPFDLVEAEQELVGGFNTEYSSIRFALFFLAEFMNTITMSAIFVTLFLGGPSGPAYFGPGLDVGLPLVLPEAHDLPVHVRVAAGVAAPVPLRPAHGPRVEAADPARTRMGAAAGRHRHRTRHVVEPRAGGRRVGRRDAAGDRAATRRGTG